MHSLTSKSSSIFRVATRGPLIASARDLEAEETIRRARIRDEGRRGWVKGFAEVVKLGRPCPLSIGPDFLSKEGIVAGGGHRFGAQEMAQRRGPEVSNPRGQNKD